LDLERAEAQLNRLVEDRARELEQANREREAWTASVRKYNLSRARERRQEWCEYHRRMVATFESLAESHREQLGRLIDSSAGVRSIELKE